MNKEQIEQFLESPEAEAVLTLAAYGILKTKTTKDDEVLADISAYAGLIAEKVKDIAEKDPTDKDAKNALMVILEKVAAETETKWDDFVVNLAKKFV